MSHTAPDVQLANAPRHVCIPKLLADHAERTPEALAILAPGRVPLTYGRLYQHVDDVVQTLHAMGLSRHDRIALVLPNGPEMAVAFLAVAASATCIPLNPAYRVNELEAYLTALRAKALIVQAGMNAPARAVGQARGLQIIELSSALEAEAGIFTLAGEKHPCVTPPGCARPNDIALVMHTSGTTARPRLVPLSHTTICTAAHALGMAYGLSASDRLLNVLPLFHSHGLISTTFASLLAGASVVCTAGFDTSRFFAWMAGFRPTWYAAVPTMHQAILACAALHREIIVRCPLRFIRSSSSALPLQVLTELERVFDAPVIEAYGMTEASSIACNPLPPRPRKPGSVGVTLAPEVAIMDETGTLLRAGEPGEIVVRGVTVMQGYDNDPLATRSAFTHGWFRTGDQGFLDADGYLFITGRLKEIINRGGEKIAPQEVDDVLMAHPAVAQAVTFAVPDSRLGEDIAAAVVLHPHVAATSRDIRLFAAMHLAYFKVPRQVLIVEEIPKGPTGKLQRLGLAEQLGLLGSDQRQPVMRAGYTAPRTPIEEILAALWAQMLEVEHVGIHDDFFQLGGDSLLATQLISRIREALHVEVSLLSFFDTPTVAGLSRIVETASRAEQGQQALAITPVPRQGPLPAAVAQEQLWLLNQILPGLPCSTLYVVRLTGALNVRALELSFNEIIKRHEALRTAFAVMNGQLVQVIAPTLSVPLQMVDLCPLPEVEREREVQHLTAGEIQQPFDLAQRPLLRLSLLRLGEREHVLLLTIHHIISDGWSISVLAHELTVLYEAFSVDAPSPLPALPIQYADFAYWQRQWQHSEAMAAQLAYWKWQLRDPLPMLHLPTDHPQAAVRSRIAHQSLVISGALSEALKSLSHREGCTPFMTLVAAFKMLLYGYTGQEDLRVGTIVANRQRQETERLIGLLTNTVILRTDLRDNPTCREVLRRVRVTALAAYSHQDLPFEDLARLLESERHLKPTSLCQVMVVLQDAVLRPLQGPPWSLGSLEIAQSVVESAAIPTTFDLILGLSEKAPGFTGTCIYKTALFDVVTINRLLADYQYVLECFIAQPEQRLSTFQHLRDGRRSCVQH